MTNILYVLVEQGVFALDRPFYYFYKSNNKIKTGTRVSVNFNNKNVIGFVVGSEMVDLTEDQIKTNYIGIKEINEVIDEEPIINEELLDLATFISKRYVCPLISCLKAMLPKLLKPSSTFKNAAKPQYFTYLQYIKDGENLTKTQQSVLENIKNNSPLKNSVSDSIRKKLLALGLIKEVKVEKSKTLSFSNEQFESFQLTKKQQEIYEGILKSEKTTSLIHGVTGSGKTEIYIKLIEETLKQSRTAVFLVPEINLTPYLCDKLNSYFNNQVSILTSGLTGSQRISEYRKILRNESKVVLGTRSAIFAPLQNLGLIIIDEEFNDCYKQSDENPQYHTIEVAKYRCMKNNAKLVLGSATPSVESMARAKNGQYELFELKERYNGKSLPNAKLINMNVLDNLYPGHSLLSKELVYAMKMAIAKNEKILLLLNKKGYSSFVTCDECNTILKCKKCNKPYTFIKDTNTFKCYHCGLTINKSEISCECGSKEFTNMGIGIQALEKSLKKIFPFENILRLDTDIANSVNKISEILNEFNKNDNHILIGTEMIAKGHDFDSVSVVGIINIDQMLNLPFYNANERIFQLITQCIGRAGRSGKEGYAYVQTYNPKSFAIEVGCAQNYDLFFKKELENRKNTANPPYFYVSTLKFVCSDAIYLKNYTYKMHSHVLNSVGNLLETSYVNKKMEKIGYKYVSSIVLKYRKPTEILEFCNEFSKFVSKNPKIQLKINIDTLNY